MRRTNFKTTIHAMPEKVWDVLWNDETYRLWAAIFMPGSYAKSDWQEGSAIEFLAPDGNGMYSVIDKKDKPYIMAFKHLGDIIKGEKEMKNWSGAMEIYTLQNNNGKTDLEVAVDIFPEFEEFFSDKMPKALQRIKELSEV